MLPRAHVVPRLTPFDACELSPLTPAQSYQRPSSAAKAYHKTRRSRVPERLRRLQRTLDRVGPRTVGIVPEVGKMRHPCERSLIGGRLLGELTLLIVQLILNGF